IMGEIQKETESKPGRLQVILDLCSEHIVEFGDSLQLNDDAAVADEIRLIMQSKLSSFVFHLNLRLLNERDILDLKLDRQTLVINRFEEPCSQLPIHLETCTEDRVGLLFEQ